MYTAPKAAASRAARPVRTAKDAEGSGGCEPELRNGRNDAHALRPVSG